ncbi:MAG: hypothetical protein ACLRPW_04760 [Intestinibacter sp.]
MPSLYQFVKGWLTQNKFKMAGIVGLWFGAFKALMPLIGYTWC